MLLEFLQFFIMVPLAILAWRGLGAFWGSRNSSSQFTNVIVPAIT